MWHSPAMPRLTSAHSKKVESRWSESKQTTEDPPLQPSPADVVPPAVAGLPQTLRCGLALKRPQAVHAILLAVVAPGGHHHLAVGTLEVEALTVAVDPAHVMMVVRLSRHCRQQTQHQHHGSRIHVGEVRPSAALPHSCLSLNSSESLCCPDVFYPGVMCNLLVSGQLQNWTSLDILRWTPRQSTDKVPPQMRVYLKRQHF